MQVKQAKINITVHCECFFSYTVPRLAKNSMVSYPHIRGTWMKLCLTSAL